MFEGCLQTSRLIIRPIRPDDRETFTRYFTSSREYFAPYFPRKDDLGLSEEGLFERELNRSRETGANGSGCRLLCFANEDSRTSTNVVVSRNDLIGAVNLNNIVRGAFHNADIGWSIRADCVGRGLATEAVKAVVGMALSPRPDGLGLHRVQAAIMPDNIPSLRVAAKVGFRIEGMALRYLKIAGSWQDHVIHAITADEQAGAALIGHFRELARG
jgi:ribosomal-protein-alanine N-acetyltransferase